jgi:hypothetical protein
MPEQPDEGDLEDFAKSLMSNDEDGLRLGVDTPASADIPSHRDRPLPALPADKEWLYGEPSNDSCRWLLQPLVESILCCGSDGGLAAFFASHFLCGAPWGAWLEHFALEMGYRGRVFGGAPDLPSTEEQARALLGGEGIWIDDDGNEMAHQKLSCVLDHCQHKSDSLLTLADHINTIHICHESIDTIDFAEVERCVCGYVYVASAVGRGNHRRWCENLSGSDSAARLRHDDNLMWLPASHAAVSVVQIEEGIHLAKDQRSVWLGGKLFVVHDCGSRFSNDFNLCFYLSVTAKLVDKQLSVDGIAAVGLKARLATAATGMSSLREGVDYGSKGTAADLEVFVAYAKAVGPIVVLDLKTFSTLRVFSQRGCSPETRAIVVLRRGEHFLRLVPVGQGLPFESFFQGQPVQVKAQCELEAIFQPPLPKQCFEKACMVGTVTTCDGQDRTLSVNFADHPLLRDGHNADAWFSPQMLIAFAQGQSVQVKSADELGAVEMCVTTLKTTCVFDDPITEKAGLVGTVQTCHIKRDQNFSEIDGSPALPLLCVSVGFADQSSECFYPELLKVPESPVTRESLNFFLSLTRPHVASANVQPSTCCLKEVTDWAAKFTSRWLQQAAPASPSKRARTSAGEL